MFKNTKKLILIGAIYGITVLVMALLWFAIPSEITAKTILSYIFTLIALTLLFGTILLADLQSREKVMQNGLLTGAAGAYLALEAILCVLLGILPVSIKAYLIIQILFLAAAIVIFLMIFMAKNHIESN